MKTLLSAYALPNPHCIMFCPSPKWEACANSADRPRCNVSSHIKTLPSHVVNKYMGISFLDFLSNAHSNDIQLLTAMR